MADVDTLMLSNGHSDIRREAVEHKADVRQAVYLEGQEQVMAIKDARHDIISATENQTDRVVDRVVEGNGSLTDRFFTVARDTADLRAQIIETINTVKMATELNSLKGIIEGQKNTTYLSDKIDHDGEKTRALINDLKYHDLSRALVERNAELVEERHARRHWRHHADQSQFAGQWAALQSQIQAFQSQLQETRQGMVNFGTMAGVGQTSTSNNVR
jgi:hypothetical protein